MTGVFGQEPTWSHNTLTLKNRFSEYYRLDDAVLKKHWEEDLFSFDANVLLNLYRYTPKTRDAFFSLLEKLKPRVWITYQAAFEYQKNRLGVINSQREAYDAIRKLLDKKKTEIEAKLNDFKRHPYLETDILKTQIHSAFEAISKDINRLESKHPDYLDRDPIWDRLTALLLDKVGDDISEPDLEKLYKEGRKRYDEHVPPGYMDEASKKSAGNRSLFGDLIVWKQLIKHSEISGTSIIFITDDRKEDWWYKFHGRTIGPRPELLKEFKDDSGHIINIYQADTFLELASRNLNEALDKEAVDEIREIRFADEKEMQLANATSTITESSKGGVTDNLPVETEFEASIRRDLESKSKK